MINDLAAATNAEVDVDVRHRDAARVKESLEEEVVLEGIDVSDSEAVSDQRAGRRPATRSHRNAVLFRVLTKSQTIRK